MIRVGELEKGKQANIQIQNNDLNSDLNIIYVKENGGAAFE